MWILAVILVLLYLWAIRDTFDNEVDSAVKPTVELIYARWCSVCRAFWPTWESAKANLGHLATFVETDGDEAKSTVRAYPTLRMKIGPTTIEHTGTIPYEELRLWIMRQKK